MKEQTIVIAVNFITLCASEFSVIDENLVRSIAGLRCRNCSVLADICEFWKYVYNYSPKLFDFYDPWHYNMLVESAFDEA